MRVAVFATCIGDTLFPRAPRATVELLERLGHTVEFPAAQTCCGQMHWNSGYAELTVPLARRFVDEFGGCGADAIVTPSGSCAAMVRHHYPQLAERQADSRMADAIRALTPSVYELSEFLVNVLGVEDVGAYYPHRVTYHPSCHGLRDLRVGDAPLKLLRRVRGIELCELEDAEQCCGFGGTFAVKNPDVSAAMLADKVRSILSSGAEVCTALDVSCLMQIGGGLAHQRTGVKAVHLAEILAGTEER